MLKKGEAHLWFDRAIWFHRHLEEFNSFQQYSSLWFYIECLVPIYSVGIISINLMVCNVRSLLGATQVKSSKTLLARAFFESTKRFYLRIRPDHFSAINRFLLIRVEDYFPDFINPSLILNKLKLSKMKIIFFQMYHLFLISFISWSIMHFRRLYQILPFLLDEFLFYQVFNIRFNNCQLSWWRIIMLNFSISIAQKFTMMLVNMRSHSISWNEKLTCITFQKTI